MNEDTERTRVLIVGAGPVGLVLACELLCAGVNVEIISKTKRESPHSRATILWPRVLELLDRVGVADRLVLGGHYFDQMNYYSNKRRIGLVRFDRLRGVAYPFAITIPQWRTERILEEHLTALGGTVRYDHTFLGGEQSVDGVTCRLREPDGRERVREFDWVVGADGYGSTVRTEFGFRFAGRSLRTRLAITDAHLVGEATSSEVGYYLTRTGNMVLAPLGDGVFRVGASVPEGHEGDTADRAFFERLLKERVPGVHGLGEMKFSGIFTAHVRSADTYHRGRVFLVGDAAHAMSPSGAQGLNTGIQDAVNLGWKLAGVVNGRYRHHLLDSYDRERRPAVEEVAALSTRLARIGLYSTWSRTSARDAAYRVGTATRLLENFLAPRLAQLDTHYGRRRRGRGPTVGERLPLGWRRTSTMPSLAVDQYTILLWPGLQYQFDRWTGFVAGLRQKVAGAAITDLGGRPPGPLADKLGTKPIALVVRPDGHLDALLRMDGGPSAHHAEELGRLVARTTTDADGRSIARPAPHAAVAP
ncbi:FAD-dependent monooxygenase [Nocardiopsis sp. YSL2]|uniref:FAD-dependent monooxygenase n=1 Tax=Nocardiopsis sp. YSL2 TaxID=2939492 RepID=UPI0026F4349E|nr:FAD-dependent monooxygenase [Nocardiopsis sp. YSL2]